MLTSVRMRTLFLVAAAAGIAAAAVFRSTLEHVALVAGSGALAWRILLAHAGLRPRRARRGSRLATWVEAAGVAWIAWRMPPRAKRERIDPREARPIAELQPVYTGKRSWRPRRPGAGGPGDQIPF